MNTQLNWNEKYRRKEERQGEKNEVIKCTNRDTLGGGGDEQAEWNLGGWGWGVESEYGVPVSRLRPRKLQGVKLHPQSGAGVPRDSKHHSSTPCCETRGAFQTPLAGLLQTDAVRCRI